MKIIDLEQGTDLWLSWRKTVITATDCPVILGSSPWSTAYKIWQRKLGLLEEQKTNDAMQRGKRLEPEARAQFIDRYAINMTSAVVESTEFDFLGASLDGLSDCYKYILEIKCGGAKLHKQAGEGYIPAYYMDQIQHQLFVTGAQKAFYYSYDGENGICIEVFPEINFQARFMPKAREFWKCVAFNEPPTLQDSDYKDMSDEPSWKEYAKKYRDLCDQIKNLEETKDNYRKELLTLCGDQNCLGEGIRALKTTVRGRIDYEGIPELKGINLDKYRNKSTTMWKVFVS
jgi:putative phage-type endonuclease